MKHIVTPVDFELKLFVTREAARRQADRHELGRAAAGSGSSITVDYPNERQPEGQGHDRIVICEDTDGDGVCDKFTVFADKLSIPTSLLRPTRAA